MEKALDYYQRALDIHREIGDRRSEGHVLANLGGLYLVRGQMDEALKLTEQALVLGRQAGSRLIEADCLGGLGIQAANAAKSEEAKQYFKQQLAITRELGHWGIERVTLQPGESRTVQFTIRPADLAFTRQDMSYGWEPGEFRLWIAPSSGAEASTPVTFTLTE